MGSVSRRASHFTSALSSFHSLNVGGSDTFLFTTFLFRKHDFHISLQKTRGFSDRCWATIAKKCTYVMTSLLSMDKACPVFSTVGLLDASPLSLPTYTVSPLYPRVPHS
jgi:hypothetical protein